MFGDSSSYVELDDIEEGKRLRVHTLDFDDAIQIDNYVRGRMISAARASFTDDTTEQERRETIDSAVRESIKISFIGPESGGPIMKSLEGIGLMLKLSVNHYNKKFTLSDAMKRLLDPGFRTAFEGMVQEQFRSDPTKAATKKSRKNQSKSAQSTD